MPSFPFFAPQAKVMPYLHEPPYAPGLLLYQMHYRPIIPKPLPHGVQPLLLHPDHAKYLHHAQMLLSVADVAFAAFHVPLIGPYAADVIKLEQSLLRSYLQLATSVIYAS